jgi:acyl carrier protein
VDGNGVTTKDRIQEIVRQTLADDFVELSESTTAADVPGWDSLAHVTIMFAIEQEFDVRFSEEEFSGFANVGELERMTEDKRARRAAS